MDKFPDNQWSINDNLNMYINDHLSTSNIVKLSN